MEQDLLEIQFYLNLWQSALTFIQEFYLIHGNDFKNCYLKIIYLIYKCKQFSYLYKRLEFRGISVCQVPREARLVLVLYGRTLQPTDHESNSSAENTMQKEELGWGAIQFFDYEG